MRRPLVRASVAGASGPQWSVTSVGLEQIVIAFHGENDALLPGETVMLLLEEGSRRLGPYVVQVDAVDALGTVCRFSHLALESAREMVRLAELVQPLPSIAGGTREHVRERSRIRSMLQALAANECRGFVRGGSPGGFSIVGYDQGEDELVCAFDGGELVNAPFFLEIEGYSSMYWLPVLDASGPSTARRIPLPDTMTRRRLRRGRRARVARTVLRYSHPVLQRVVERPVTNVSHHGLAFSMDDDDLFSPSMQLEDVEVVYDFSKVVRFRARVCSVARTGGVLCCGLSVELGSVSSLDHWSGLVESWLHPTTKSRAIGAEPLWELFTASGYFDLSGRTAGEFESQRSAFERASAQLQSSPAIGCQVVFPAPDERELHATLSLLKTYTHAWLGFHMAKRPGRVLGDATARQMLRAIHLHAYEHASVDPALRWFLGYVQEGTRFSRLVHQDFAARHADEGAAAVVPFRAMKTTTDPRPVETHGTRASPASEFDVRRVLRQVAGTRSPAYVDALDLEPQRFRMHELTAAWRAAGLERERELFVVRHDDRLLAAAVSECASTGLHLYGLLDCVRIFTFESDWQRGRDALLELCRQWFEVRGRDSFAVLLEGSEPEVIPGFVDLGLANLTIVSAELLGDLLEHVYEVTAPGHVA